MKQNILYLHSHDTGRWIQPYGFPVNTPRLQQFAQEGVLFRNAFCVTPTCGPSRTSVMTGQYPHQSGGMGQPHLGFSLKNPQQQLVTLLKEGGYRCGLCGVGHLASMDEYGFDFIETGKSESAIAAAKTFMKAKSDAPFFLSLGLFETHRPWSEAEGELPIDLTLLPEFSDADEIQTDLAAYAQSAEQLDKHIGNVLDFLEAQGLSENTLVICTTDHGPPFPHYKCNLTDGGLGVFMMLRGAGAFLGGKESQAMVTLLDILPTVCEVAGIAIPDWAEGKSLKERLDKNEGHSSPAIYGEINFHGAYEPVRSVRTPGWKYIRRFHDYPHPFLRNTDESPTKRLLLKQGWGAELVSEETLYHLKTDPHEKTNLIHEPQYQEQAKAMEKLLSQWMQATDDPLLKGAIEPPKGATVFAPDAKM